MNRKMKKIVGAYSMIAIVLIICMSLGMSSMAQERKAQTNVSFINCYYSGAYRLGNSIEEILKGGTHLDLGEQASIFYENGKIIDRFKDKILGFIPKEKELVLAENVEAKNINILDETGNKLDDTVYYTDKGIVKYVNVKTMKQGMIEKLSDKNVDMMYLANNSYLYCMCKNEMIRYDVKMT